MINIAEKIKAIRIDKKLKQREIAEKIGVSINGYQKIESGETDVNFSRLQQIAEVFEMSVVEVIEYPEKEKRIDTEVLHELTAKVKELQSTVRDKQIIIKSYDNLLNDCFKVLVKIGANQEVSKDEVSSLIQKLTHDDDMTLFIAKFE